MFAGRNKLNPCMFRPGFNKPSATGVYRFEVSIVALSRLKCTLLLCLVLGERYTVFTIYILRTLAPRIFCSLSSSKA